MFTLTNALTLLIFLGASYFIARIIITLLITLIEVFFDLTP